MLKDIKFESILFLDIETVPEVADYNELSEKKQSLWEKKSEYFRKEDEDASDVFSRAGIYAEFGKVICISVGMMYSQGNDKHLRLKSFYSDDEKKLLSEFIDLLGKLRKKPDVHLCGHNGKEFDFPYLARRILINGLELPFLLDVAGKKPWEVSFLDTMDLWKFGDYKHYTSLDLLTSIFNIPTPKDDIDGSMVGKVYWVDGDLERIVKYCEKDVVAVVQLFLKFQGKELLPEEKIETTTFET
ncbi:MAG: 3'-5' exonuclease [Bacteroidales bacterium]|nr:3'-5' exonuclease [Bacteroidales bacterium]